MVLIPAEHWSSPRQEALLIPILFMEQAAAQRFLGMV